MILNKSQAEAVYSAICALNNIGACLHVRICNADDAQFIHVKEHLTDEISVWRGPASDSSPTFYTTEWVTHSDQNAFAKAYGLS